MKKSDKEKPKQLLIRSKNDKVIAGVAGGIAEYFEVDANLVRFAFILVTLLGGAGIPLYFILWLLLPSQSSRKTDTLRENIDEMKDVAHKVVEEFKTHHEDEKQEKKPHSQKWLALFLILIGVLFLLNNFGMLWWFSLEKWWPVILIGLGVVVFFRHEKK